MNYFVYDPFAANRLKPELLSRDCPIDGFFLQYGLQNFLFEDGFTNISIVKDAIKTVSASGKKVSLSFIFGSQCGTIFYNEYPHVELSEKHLEGKDYREDAVRNKFPAFYDENYLLKIESFIKWLSEGLAPVLKHIHHIKVSGINQTTFEMRIPNQDFTTTDIPEEAYKIGAQKWLELDYQYNKMLTATESIIGYWAKYFPDTLKIVSLIGGLNGGVTIDRNNNICEPKLRPDFTTDTIEVLKQHHNFAVQATAFSNDGGTPSNIMNKGLPVYFQLEYRKYGKAGVNVEEHIFENTLLKALVYDCPMLEIYESNVKQFSELLKKYAQVKS